MMKPTVHTMATNNYYFTTTQDSNHSGEDPQEVRVEVMNSNEIDRDFSRSKINSEKENSMLEAI